MSTAVVRLSGPVALVGEVDERGLHAPAEVLGARQPELQEDRVDVLLDGALGEEELLGDRLVRLALRDLGEDLELARRELRERRRARAACAAAMSASDHLRVDDRAALGHRAQRRDQLGAVGEPLLEEVRAPVGPVLEQREGVLRRGVLAHHDDARSRVRLAQPVGDRDALVLARRRHPDVGQHRRRGARPRPRRGARRRPRRSRRARARACPRAGARTPRGRGRSRPPRRSAAAVRRSVVTAVPARSCANRRKRGGGGRRPALAAAPSMR